MWLHADGVPAGPRFGSFLLDGGGGCFGDQSPRREHAHRETREYKKSTRSLRVGSGKIEECKKEQQACTRARAYRERIQCHTDDNNKRHKHTRHNTQHTASTATLLLRHSRTGTYSGTWRHFHIASAARVFVRSSTYVREDFAHRQVALKKAGARSD